MGFSLDEMNETTTQGFIDVAAAWNGGEDDEGVREATGRESEAYFG